MIPQYAQLYISMFFSVGIISLSLPLSLLKPHKLLKGPSLLLHFLTQILSHTIWIFNPNTCLPTWFQRGKLKNNNNKAHTYPCATSPQSLWNTDSLLHNPTDQKNTNSLYKDHHFSTFLGSWPMILLLFNLFSLKDLGIDTFVLLPSRLQKRPFCEICFHLRVWYMTGKNNFNSIH